MDPHAENRPHLTQGHVDGFELNNKKPPEERH
jgi:hypothetical protein